MPHEDMVNEARHMLVAAFFEGDAFTGTGCLSPVRDMEGAASVERVGRSGSHGVHQLVAATFAAVRGVSCESDTCTMEPTVTLQVRRHFGNGDLYIVGDRVLINNNVSPFTNVYGPHDVAAHRFTALTSALHMLVFRTWSSHLMCPLIATPREYTRICSFIHESVGCAIPVKVMHTLQTLLYMPTHVVRRNPTYMRYVLSLTP